MTTKNCDTCGNSWAWHEETQPRHAFNDGSLSPVDTFGRKKDGNRVPKSTEVEVQLEQWPFDPVLRQALMDKGVLTPEDLSAAERKIRAVTSQFLPEEASNVQGTEQPSGTVIRRDPEGLILQVADEQPRAAQ